MRDKNVENSQAIEKENQISLLWVKFKDNFEK